MLSSNVQTNLFKRYIDIQNCRDGAMQGAYVTAAYIATVGGNRTRNNIKCSLKDIS